MTKRKKLLSKPLSKLSKTLIISSVILVILLFTAFGMYRETGIFQESELNSRDLIHWNYSHGQIIGAEPVIYSGSRDTCWILVHGYGATPAEMKTLAKKISDELGQTVYIPLLSGHASLPSNLSGKNISTWYDEVNDIIVDYNKRCESINLVGSSLTAPLVLRIAEEMQIGKIFVISSFIYMPYKIHRILPLRTYINLLAPYIHYNKKIEIAQIKDKNNQKNHIAYWNMPYEPIKDSFEFIDQTVNKLNNITEPVFIAHSPSDPTASRSSATIIYNNVNSKVKEIKWYKNSKHVLLLDYDKETLMQDIINFEKEH